MTPEASDPLGQYIAELFSISGMSDAIAEKSRRGEISQHLHGLRDGLISAGVDAAIIYASMLDAFSTAGTAIAIPEPYDLRDRIVFGTGVILRDGHPKPAAERFVAFLLSDLGQAILTAGGFLPKSAVSTTALLIA